MLTRLIHHAGWNLAGQGLPMLVALVSIPLLIREVGADRFGFIAIAWIVVGYFGVLDLGIGRAMTHSIAGRLAEREEADLGDLVGTGLTGLLVLGVAAGGLLALSAPWIVGSVITIDAALHEDAVRAMYVLAIAVPFILLSAGLRGILEAHRRFPAINKVQLPAGVLLYGVPILAARMSPTLTSVLLAMAAVRALSSVAFLELCRRTPSGLRQLHVSGPALRQLLSFGGWMTVTNVVSPIMVNMDRLFIGSALSVTAVTYYVTPFEVITKLLLLPNVVANVAFPEMTRLAASGSLARARSFAARSLGLVMIALIPAAGIIALAAHPLLSWWVSVELAERSAPIMQLLALGVVINGAAYVPFAFIQAAGRADITARFHLIELLVYVPGLFALISWLGLRGVALAWVLRVTLDAALLFWYANRLSRAAEDARPAF